MANIKSKKKRILTNAKSHDRNVAQRSAIKSARRKVLEAVEGKEFDKAQELFRAAESVIGKACQKGVLKKNAAARRVSRLASHIVKAKAAA
ncbi:MAG: 30S ribosomal protein S20 [Candidatus Dependentiae bacterium]|jgi:small subunit ribosomal protein S20